MERHFDRELDDLRNTLIRMGSLVEEQLTASLHALAAGDVASAASIVLRDAAVDAFDSEIERKCQSLLALNQPVAIDLRLLMAALRINSQLERIGDIAVNIAERVAPLQSRGSYLHATRLSEMAEIARIMVHDSLDAFLLGKSDVAHRVLDSDDVVDRLDRTVFQRVVADMQEHADMVVPGAHVLILCRHIERLADHATNIAEDVIFLIEARMVRHFERA